LTIVWVSLAVAVPVRSSGRCDAHGRARFNSDRRVQRSPRLRCRRELFRRPAGQTCSFLSSEVPVSLRSPFPVRAWLIGLMAVALLVVTAFPGQPGQQPQTPREKQIQELIKQIDDLTKKLNDLKQAKDPQPATFSEVGIPT